MKDIFFFVKPTVDANPMGQLGGAALRAVLGLDGRKFMGGATHVAPGFGFSFLWYRHSGLLKNLLNSMS
jgi:hypothetical protein